MSKSNKDNKLLKVKEVENFKCHTCPGYLSTSPITQDKDNNYICGKCSKRSINSNNKSTSSTIASKNKYKILAKYFIFPCRNSVSGCMVEQPFDEFGNHEEECNYRIINCPLKSKKCTTSWKGSLLDLKEHLKNEHNEYIEKCPYQFKFMKRNTKEDIFLEVDDNFFAFRIHYVEVNDTFDVSVRFIGESQSAANFMYKICMDDENCSATFTKKNTVLKYFELIHDDIIRINRDGLVKLMGQADTSKLQSTCTVKRIKVNGIKRKRNTIGS